MRFLKSKEAARKLSKSCLLVSLVGEMFSHLLQLNSFVIRAATNTFIDSSADYFLDESVWAASKSEKMLITGYQDDIFILPVVSKSIQFHIIEVKIIQQSITLEKLELDYCCDKSMIKINLLIH